MSLDAAANPFTILDSPLNSAQNLYAQDIVLQAQVKRLVTTAAAEWIAPQLDRMGALAANELVPLAATADKESPKLRTHDRFGNRISAIEYHPAYRKLEELGYGAGIVAMKYDAGNRSKFRGNLQVSGFALGYLFAQTESGMTCPVCMTDGVARVLEMFGTKDQQARFIPHLASTNRDTLFRGAMFLTEKQGGSDVGRNATQATPNGDGSWRLDGEKWFCSNVDAEAILALARLPDAPPGTRGLGLFLVPSRVDGKNNGLRIDRLKDKLGTRSMPTGEVVLEGARAELVGEPGHGFKQMAEMLNLSRLWNAVASAAIVRRALHESVTYLRARHTFGKPAIEHALVKETVADLAAESAGVQALVLQLAHHLDRADAGQERDRALVRILTPLAKYTSAKTAVWAASEAIECLGGNGYVEEAITPRLLRDAQVLPVWEGTTNILVLDVMRACVKLGAHEVLFDDTLRRTEAAPAALADVAAAVRTAVGRTREELQSIVARGIEAASGDLRRCTDRLLFAYETALLFDGADTGTDAARVLAASARRLARLRLDPSLATPADDLAALSSLAVRA